MSKSTRSSVAKSTAPEPAPDQPPAPAPVNGDGHAPDLDVGGPDGNGTGAMPAALKSRIDPAAICVDWDVEAMADEEDKTPAAKWGRPPKDNFVRAHPTWTVGVYLLDCKESMGLDAEYILAADVARRLIEEDEPVASCQVYLLIDRDGGLRFWPVKLGDPTEQARPSDHIRTALAAVERARKEWVKIYWRSLRGGNGWRARSARVELPEPAWPEDPRALFLDTVVDRYIGDPEDRIILKYLGRA